MLPKALEGICDWFDCRVIHGEIPDDNGNWKSAFFLGNEGDMSVGIHPYDMTPDFDTEAQLRAFVESETGRAAINRRADEEFLDWNAQTQDFDDT